MDIIRNIPNSIVIFIIIITCLIFTVNLNLVDITIMEARNFVTAREMLQDNNWLMPTFNGEARYEKPPLPTWIAAISTIIFGSKSLYLFRLPGFLCLSIIGITSYYFSLELVKNKLQSIVNSFISITSFYMIAIIVEAPWDIFSHSFMFVGIYYLLRALNNKKFNFKNIFLISIFIASSFLSKGPISIYALLIPFLISYFITNPKSIGNKLIKIIPIILTGVIIGSCWYIIILIEDPTNLINVTKKETSNWTNYNIRPFYYYWSFFIQSGLWSIIAFLSLIYPYFKNKIKDYKSYRFTFLWTMIGVLLLSLIPEKKPRYLMPILIPLALNIGFICRYLLTEFNKNKVAKLIVIFHYIIAIFLGLSFVLTKIYILNYSINIADILLAIFSIVMIIKVLNIKYLPSVKINILFFLILIFSISNSPTLITKTNKSFKSINTLNLSEIELYTNYSLSPEIIWSFGKKIKKLDNIKIKQLSEEKIKFGLLTKNPITVNDTILNESNYTIKLVSKYDLNTQKKKSRLITYYHLFAPK